LHNDCTTAQPKKATSATLGGGMLVALKVRLGSHRRQLLG